MALPSIFGTLMSFIFMGIVIGYSAQRLDILLNRKDVDILQTVRDNYFSDNEAFTGEEGFNIAIALTGFDSVRDSVLDPEYANLIFETSQWDVLEDGEINWQITSVASHTCSEEELGLTGDYSRIMPAHETSTAYVNLYKKKFVCLNKEDLKIYGTFNSKKAQLLRASLIRCSGKDFCKSEEEINEYMKDKYLLVLTN